MNDLRDLAPRLWAWAQLHTVRAWVCAFLLAFLLIIVVSQITGWGTEPY